jgi:hypothetical protein
MHLKSGLGAKLFFVMAIAITITVVLSEWSANRKVSGFHGAY